MNIEDILERMMEYYVVTSHSELADKLGIIPQNISKWKTRNSIDAVKKKCRELGIYSEIFEDINMQKRMKEVEYTETIFNRLFDYFEIDTIKELSEQLNMPQSTISKWRQRNSIVPIRKACRKLGIFNEIFKDKDEQNVQEETESNSCLSDYLKSLELLARAAKKEKALITDIKELIFKYAN